MASVEEDSGSIPHCCTKEMGSPSQSLTGEINRMEVEHSHTMEHKKMGPGHPDYHATTIMFTEGISSVRGGIFNYANTYVGAGIIGIPLARE